MEAGDEFRVLVYEMLEHLRSYDVPCVGLVFASIEFRPKVIVVIVKVIYVVWMYVCPCKDAKLLHA